MITTKAIGNAQYIMVSYKGVFMGLFHRDEKFVNVAAKVTSDKGV